MAFGTLCTTFRRKPTGLQSTVSLVATASYSELTLISTLSTSRHPLRVSSTVQMYVVVVGGVAIGLLMAALFTVVEGAQL